MATYITEDGSVYYENVPEEKRKLFPNIHDFLSSPEIQAELTKWFEDNPDFFPFSVERENYDIDAETTNYEEVYTHEISKDKLYLLICATIYASGRPTGLQLKVNTSTITTVENADYTQVYLCYPFSYPSDATITVLEKRGSTGKHTGVVALIEI